MRRELSSDEDSNDHSVNGDDTYVEFVKEMHYVIPVPMHYVLSVPIPVTFNPILFGSVRSSRKANLGSFVRLSVRSVQVCLEL